MSKIVFASILPHAPILLPNIGSFEDHQLLKKTLNALKEVEAQFRRLKIDEIIISSPHPDWGFDVPLYFLANDFKGRVRKFLISLNHPREYFEEGKKYSKQLDKNKNYALVASGDLSHCLKEDGPYGFHPDGPLFDKELVEDLKKRKIKEMLELEDKYPKAGNCGLRPIAFILGIIEGAGLKIKPKILSYEGPFGVGYLVAKLI